jgi:formylglycine-generating enzyme required for sulfatase activity
VAEYNEYPKSEITLTDYFIGPHEVTVSEYSRCVQAKSCPEPGRGDRCDFWIGGHQHYPINCVTWFGAAAYANWLGRKEGRPACYDETRWEVTPDCRGYRLPSEAEWEKAARGSDGREYPWGSAAPTCSLANVKNCLGEPGPVNTYPQGVSPAGLFDMAGNLYEWVNDWYETDYYRQSPLTNPTGPVTGISKVARGGSWNDDGVDARVANRNAGEPSQGYDDVGFRLVRFE